MNFSKTSISSFTNCWQKDSCSLLGLSVYYSLIVVCRVNLMTSRRVLTTFLTWCRTTCFKLLALNFSSNFPFHEGSLLAFLATEWSYNLRHSHILAEGFLVVLSIKLESNGNLALKLLDFCNISTLQDSNLVWCSISKTMTAYRIPRGTFFQLSKSLSNNVYTFNCSAIKLSNEFWYFKK